MSHKPYILSFVTFFNEFNPAIIHRDLPEIKKVIYYIHAWQFHSPPDPSDTKWASNDLVCDVRKLPPIAYEDLLQNVKEGSYDTPTLVVIQKIL